MAATKEKFYYKLGDKASSFYDPITKLLLRGNTEVVELEKRPKSSKVARALQGGHIVKVSKADYDEYVGESQKPEVPAEVNRDIPENNLKLSKKEKEAFAKLFKNFEDDEDALMEDAKEFGFNEEDLALLQASLDEQDDIKVTLLKYIEIRRTYKS